MDHNKVLIIAEIGVNHNGDVNLAKRIVDAVIDTDVDIIKFQTVVPELLMVPNAPMAAYQLDNDKSDSAFEMISNLALSADDFIELKKYIEDRGKIFLSTAFDHGSLEFLSRLGLSLFKIPSGEITNLPYLRDVASRAEKIILSTGMATFKEVEAAVNSILDRGFKRENLTVLQCNTAYPTPIESSNLAAMVQMGTALDVSFGFSDHTSGYTAALAAVALGASVIEKHVTLDKGLPGPDHLASMEPSDFSEYVKEIRNVTAALGSNEKLPTSSELVNKAIARRGLYAAVDIPAGKIITEDDVIALRPENQISPMEIDLVIGTKAKQTLQKYAEISWENLI